MKIILIHESVNDLSETLKSEMTAQGYELIPFTQSDEILQLGKHLGKVVVCFTDSRKASRFISTCEKFDEFKILNILCVARTPIINEDVQSKLDQLNLKLYYPVINDKLKQDLSNFFDGQLHEEDIKFNTGIE